MRSPEAAADEVRAIQTHLEHVGDRALLELVPLTANDCGIIGLIIQSFAYADLNARRAIEIVDYLQGIPIPDVNRTLRDNQVWPTLRARIALLPLSHEETGNLETALTMIERFVSIRHHLAHWAARRHPTADALVAMTFNAREASRRAGHAPERFKATFAVIPMPEVRANLPILEKNADYLASRVADWWKRYMPPEMQ